MPNSTQKPQKAAHVPGTAYRAPAPALSGREPVVSRQPTQPPDLPPPTRPKPAARSQSAAAMPPEQPQHTVATALLQLQSSLNEARSRNEIAYIVVNESRTIMRAQQVVLLLRGPQNSFSVGAISSISTVDRSSPVVTWFESLVATLEKDFSIASVAGLTPTTFAGEQHAYGRQYPLGHLLWVPWLDSRGQVFAGMLMARTMPFSEAEAALARHAASTFSQAWRAMTETPWQTGFKARFSRRMQMIALAATLLALALPVSMTALAPVETAPRAAAIVTASVEGVVKSVTVEPNQTVARGDVLLQMVDTNLRNRFDIAEREVGVAAMRYKKASQLAFSDARGRHELAIAHAELALRTTERDFAMELLSRAEIRAERDGVAFFSDKKDLVGRPVSVGEKLMEIANPEDVEFRIDLNVADAIVLHEGARVKIFLDSDPLNPINAKLVRAGYRARLRENQQLAFRLIAEADRNQAAQLRLGVRGTAQVYSDKVPLGFYLFRRPIAAARQWLGL